MTSGASARLNRELAEGFLDIAVLYDPVFRADIGSEPLFEDELVLVTGGDPASWRDDYVRIEWGRGLGVEIASRLDLAPESGLVLDLGGRAGDWLIAQRAAGFMPRRAVTGALASGTLRIVEDTPAFSFPAYACWSREMEPKLVAEMVLGLRQRLGA